MATAHEDTLQALLERHLPPTEAGFARLVEAYLASASRPRFLLALTRLRKQVEVPGLDDHGISQYLFKFACAIVDERIAAQGVCSGR